MSTNFKQTVFSGVQPTGNLHLGNYLGAIKNFVELQKKMECIYCVVDLHAITVFQDPKELKKNMLETTAAFLACGLDFKKSIIFNQSSLSEHTELAWILNCVSRIGWLNRMTQFKEKAGKNKENASVGLYVYPNLMAADILLYKATHVPVGDDQKQHLELVRDIAQKFNNDYKSQNFFPIPEPLIQKKLSRVMSLRDGKSKMSKSDESEYSRINLTDDADAIEQKIRKAKTDPESLPSSPEGLEGRAEAQNLVGIYAALADVSVEAVLKEFGGRGFGDFKPALAELAVTKLSPMGEKMRELLELPEDIDNILDEGAARAQAIVAPIIDSVSDIIGLLGHK